MNALTLATKLDEFSYDVDYYEYVDSVDLDDRDANVTNIKIELLNGRAPDFIDYLSTFANDEDEVVDIVFVYEFTDAIVERIYSETKQVFFANSQLVK